MLVRFNRWVHVWWPVPVSLAAMAVAVGMFIVTVSVIDERNSLREQAADLDELIRLRRQDDRDRDERIAEAVKKVDEAFIRRLSQHDADVQFQNSVLLYEIALLLNRPAGVMQDPVTAKPFPSASPPAGGPTAPKAQPRSSTKPAPRPSPAPAPTTTRPNQKSCAKKTGPKC